MNLIAVAPSEKVAVRLTVNGRRYDIQVQSRVLLSDALRHVVGLTGTHVGCEHGVCGCCTVLLDGEPVRSCLVFAVQAEGYDVRTVEGLAGLDGTLHPLQEAFRLHHGLQCGFCTPGFLMSALAMLDDVPNMTDDELREALSGNLCRCTGYAGILQAVRAASQGPNSVAGEDR